MAIKHLYLKAYKQWCDKKNVLRDRLYQRDYQRKRRIGSAYWVGIESKLLEKQKGLCVICSKRLIKPCLDHNHKTGCIRGLLCNSCNRFVLPVIEHHLPLVERCKVYLASFV